MKLTKPKFLIEAGKNFKFIKDALGSKEAVRFKISVEVEFHEKTEPISIFIEGERASDGGWSTRRLINQNQDVLSSREALEESLESIKGQVSEYILQNALVEDWKELTEAMNEIRESGYSLVEWGNRAALPMIAVTAYGYEALFCAPIMAIAYVNEGTQALAKNDLSYTSHCVQRGQYFSGAEMLISNPNKWLTDRAITGGIAKKFLREPIKIKVSELLKSLAPVNGWASTTDAIRMVAYELNDNHSDLVESCKLKTENLPRTIKEWMKSEPEKFHYSITSEA